MTKAKSRTAAKVELMKALGLMSSIISDVGAWVKQGAPAIKHAEQNPDGTWNLTLFMYGYNFGVEAGNDTQFGGSWWKIVR